MKTLTRRKVLFISLLVMSVAFNSSVNGSESHIVVDAETGIILIDKDPEKVRQIASLTKIATTVVALEWIKDSGGGLSQKMAVTSQAVAGGANPLALKVGDFVSLESAVYAAMMASDNTSASIIAEHIGHLMDPTKLGEDAVQNFVVAMNQLAESLGMEGTKFVNPHGLDGDGDLGVSTAEDVARLTMHAYTIPEFFGFCSEKEHEVIVERSGSDSPTRILNTNELVGSRGIDGTKTGTTFRAGACLVASATREFPETETGKPKRLIVVVLKSEDRFRDAVLLLNEGWVAYEKWLTEGERLDTNHSLLNKGN